MAEWTGDQLICAADALRDRMTPDDEDAALLLSLLSIDPLIADGLSSTTAVEPLLRHLAYAERVFAVQPPDAPGLVFAGGSVSVSPRDGAGNALTLRHATGVGTSLIRALFRLGGELAEHTASSVNGTASLVTLSRADARAHLLPVAGDPYIEALIAAGDEQTPRAWLAGRRLSDDARFLIPAEALSWLSDHSPPDATGRAAGQTDAAAVYAGLCECIERDAVARWWWGGHPASVLHVTGAAEKRWHELHRQAQRGRDRVTVLLAIGTHDAPVVVAYSALRDGQRFAAGFAARADLWSAVEAAFRELCQMEMGLHLVDKKHAEAGADALSAQDRCQLARATLLRRCPSALTPSAVMTIGDVSAPIAPEAGIDRLRAALDDDGLDGIWCELASAAAMTVGVVVVPGLQRMNRRWPTARLRAAPRWPDNGNDDIL